MTLVVAVIDQVTGAVAVGADSKVTWAQDESRTRRVYTEPALKIIYLHDDLVVGYAGDGPDVLASAVTSLRGRGVDEVLEGLSLIAGASFVVAHREPARIWTVSAELGVEERTAIGRAWAGDRSAFARFQARFDDFADDSVLFRLQSTMQHIVHLVRPEPVGGYTILVAGDATKPFRYVPLRSELWPESFDATVSGRTENPDRTVNFTARATFAEAPLVLHVIPGAAPTPGALGLYVENSGLGYVYPDRTPAPRATVRADALEDFVRLAETEHGQSLLPR